MSRSQREKGIILSYVTMAFNLLIGFIFTPFLTRTLGDSEYGLYTSAASIIAFIKMLDMGLGNSMVRFASKMKAEKDKPGEMKLNGMFLLMFTGIGILSVFVGLGVSVNIGSFLEKFTPEEVERVRLIFLILLINIALSFPFNVVSAQLSSHERFAFLKIYNLVTDMCRYGLEAIILVTGFKSVGLAVASTFVSVVSKLVPIIYCKRNIEIKFSFKNFDKAIFREVASYSFFIFLNLLVDQLYANTDKLLLGRYIGTSAVAIFGIASNLSRDFNLFSTSISGVFLPNITKLVATKTGMQEISKTFIRTSRLQFIILSFVYTGFLIFGKQFIVFWVGDFYTEAYYITLILMSTSIVTMSQNIGVSVLQAMNKHRVRSVMYLVIAVLNLGLTIPMCIKWSGIGAAIATAFGNFCGRIVFMNWYYHKKIGLDMKAYWKGVFLRLGIVPAIYGTIGYLLLGKNAYPNVFALLAAIIAYTLIYAPFAWFLVLNQEEKGLVIEKLNGLKRKLKK